MGIYHNNISQMMNVVSIFGLIFVIFCGWLRYSADENAYGSNRLEVNFINNYNKTAKLCYLNDHQIDEKYCWNIESEDILTLTTHATHEFQVFSSNQENHTIPILSSRSNVYLKDTNIFSNLNYQDILCLLKKYNISNLLVDTLSNYRQVILICICCYILILGQINSKINIINDKQEKDVNKRHAYADTVCSTHHVLKLFAIIAMIMDHYGRIFVSQSTTWIFPAQFVGSNIFYFLVGYNEKAFKTMSSSRSICIWFIILHYIVGVSKNTDVYTLFTIALLRLMLNKFSIHLSCMNDTFHYFLIGSLLLCEPIVGYEGLGLAYGSRAIFFAMFGYLKQLSIRKPKEYQSSTTKRVLLIWLLSGLYLVALKNYHNVLGRFEWQNHLLLVFVSYGGVAIEGLVFYYYERKHINAMQWFAYIAKFTSKYALTIYVVHLLFYKACEQVYKLDGILMEYLSDS